MSAAISHHIAQRGMGIDRRSRVGAGLKPALQFRANPRRRNVLSCR